jgi:hypothetical protein
MPHWKNFVVQVFATTDEAKGIGKMGTGYPIAKDRILTARHVVLPNNKKPTKIEARWPQAGGDSAWQPAKVLWPQNAEEGSRLDVAVLETTFPPDIDWRYLSSGRPTDAMDFASESFAFVGKTKNGEYKSVPLDGKIYGAADFQDHFFVSVGAPPTIPEGWRGASGGPVMVSGRLLGVLVECPENFGQARLKATPTWKLLELSSFVSAAEYKEYEQRREKMRNELAGRLEKMDDDVRKKLADYLKLPDDTPVALADNLCLLDIDALLDAFDQVHYELYEEGQKQAAENLFDIVKIVAPKVADHAIVSKITNANTGLSFLVWDLPVRTRNLLELVMAAADDKPLRYQPPESEFAFSKSTQILDDFPDFSVDPNQKADGIRLGLVNKYSAPPEHGKKYIPTEIEIQNASRTIAYMAKRSKRGRPCCAFEVTGDERSHQAAEDVIEPLSRQFPAAAFVELAGAPEQEVAENDTMRYISQMLWRMHSEDKT